MNSEAWYERMGCVCTPSPSVSEACRIAFAESYADGAPKSARSISMREIARAAARLFRRLFLRLFLIAALLIGIGALAYEMRSA